uniref:Phenylalanine--tRNA ligase beta subunit, chloroplastic n=1 Tax=Chaetoceros laevisporus TaxID=1937691 RepID=A0A8F5JA15_9STRA|nr:phenylalanine-tRNA ligase beta subunit [Chaetoceros laevisporus]
MYTSLDWINELVSLETVQLNDLIDKLTLGGFEVEETLEIEINKQKKTILDISATANRADSLSIKGIAKEVTALLNTESLNSSYTQEALNYQEQIKEILISSNSSLNYSTFVGITIENLTNFSIPKWLTEKLICSEIEPSKTLLDFQTYILLETGYPFEFYDLDKLKKNIKTEKFELTLKPATENVTFVASNDVTYNLNSDILVVEANNYPLSIAGIVSNNEICYTSETKSLLIEASIFNSKKIRQQSRIIGLRTDRSARYEKGLNNSSFIEALIRLISLLKISNPELVCKIHTTSQVQQPKLSKINLKYETIIEILGPIQNDLNTEPTQLQPIQITNYLDRLNFIFSFNEENLTWLVEVPISRVDDIEREIDLIEEIGRLHGFNNFITDLPNIYNIGKEDFSYQVRKKLTSCFLNEGFNELMQYSLVNETASNNIQLINPLITDYSTLRTSLLPKLINIVGENLKQSNYILEGFEYGHVFLGDINSNYIEKEVVSGIFGGLKSKRQWNEPAIILSWFEAKGKIEELFKKLNITVYWKNSTLEKYENILHPYRTAELYLSDESSLGVFGQIHPVAAKKNNISTELFLFEFNFETLKNEFKQKKLALYQPYSLYPKITKDLSFIVDQKIPFKEIKTTILKHGTEYLTHLELLDEYQGSSIPKHKTSLCIQLTFQSTEKTLVTKEIDNILDNLYTVLKTQYNINIRI